MTITSGNRLLDIRRIHVEPAAAELPRGREILARSGRRARRDRYDIGETSDCSLDATVPENVRDLVELFRDLPNAKAGFATKYVDRELLEWEPRGRTRVRFSLMPVADSKLLDIRTSPVADRIAAINDFVAAGYEVHVDFSPVVVGEGRLESWAELQQAKRLETGGWNVRYRTGHKGPLRDLLDGPDRDATAVLPNPLRVLTKTPRPAPAPLPRPRSASGFSTCSGPRLRPQASASAPGSGSGLRPWP
ncbi:spore photoproduct lyase family protein [Nonomuraea sp. NPDC050643]|uniref:spore photoproduct lyase family protein n=1 Tax=Nonomuraea sp. NPDC050643 TaxID=3155660 RepID=UPI00340EF771